MPRYIAFLRALNVGGRTIKMDRLRAMFEAAGFTGVETFIASGNVIFEAQNTELGVLTQQIEAYLEQELGYTVDTYLRTPAEVAAIAAYRPPRPDHAADSDDSASLKITIYVIFLSAPLNKAGLDMVQKLETDIDTFHVNGREIYWLCQQTMSKSTVSGAQIANAVQMPVTIRNLNTIRRLAAKYPPSS